MDRFAPHCTCGDGSIDVKGRRNKGAVKGLKSRDSAVIALKGAASGNPFFRALTIVLTTGKTQVETTELLFVSGETIELLENGFC